MGDYSYTADWLADGNTFTGFAPSDENWITSNGSDLNFDSYPTFCDLGEACDDGACDPQAVVPCAAFEQEPCYDPNCAPTCAPDCELDGMNMPCNEPHNALLIHDNHNNQQSAATQFAHPQHMPQSPTPLGYSNFNPQYQPQFGYPIAQMDAPQMGSSNNTPHTYGYTANPTPCYHPVEHAAGGCINPLAMHLHMPLELAEAQHGGFFRCCCSSPSASDHSAVGDSQITSEQLQLPQQTQQTQQQQPTGDRKNHRLESQPSVLVAGTIEASDLDDMVEAIVSSSSSEVARVPKQRGSTIRSSKTAARFMCMWQDERLIPCQCTFGNTAELHKHVNDHHVPKRLKKAKADQMGFVCPWKGCRHAKDGKSFRILKHLKDHIHTHTGFKQFVCDHVSNGKVCGMAFAEKKALTIHRRTHTDEQPFKCSHCGKKFKHNNTMKNHEQTHNKVAHLKRYKCPECDHRNDDRANMTRHIDTHYDNRYSCKLCNSSFSKKANAHRHLAHGSCKQYHNFPIPKERLPEFIHIAAATHGPIDFALLETKPDTTTGTVGLEGCKEVLANDDLTNINNNDDADDDYDIVSNHEGDDELDNYLYRNARLL